ncbi:MULTISPECIES: hypothetical protein [unclassified Ensifer]|uniref:hypothetical protein n=1 Tax=unclassified Ensifer TaxID=2633371 RepID=UPI000713ED61|nr:MULTISPECIES: hypothetical protein [unclassified Ensifer]KQX55446.1 hypothetical protein ASD49_25155 [Ensifer sp. Root1298]KQX90938.1 hypothetical protein ASD41_23845 [Ensifer sp. Root1312]KRC25782.1 hypothetical protein ASE29_22305 [Ensifer sp. Root74]KRD73662.1 hypothetical protein ASE71_19630 [Ensifer sp. Root954]
MQQAICLYLDLNEGQKADLEVVAKAALAFDAAVKEIAFVLDPGAVIRVELESGTEGSLSLNSIISAIGPMNRVRLQAIAFALLTWFGAETASYVYSAILDQIKGDEQALQLSEEQIKEMSEQVAKICEGKVGARQVGDIFKELEKDPAVRGVGVTTNKDKKPRYVVPRSQFQERSRSISETQEVTSARTTTGVQTLTLISPVLVEGPRKWKFRSGQVEFGATVKDADFVQRVLAGRELPMAAGIVLKVKLTVKEEMIDEVWHVKERIVEEVLEVVPAPNQQEMEI